MSDPTSDDAAEPAAQPEPTEGVAPTMSDKDAIHAQIDAAVDAAAAGAHDDEAHKMERIRAHAETIKALIDDLTGEPDMVTEYFTPPAGGPAQERVVVARTGEVVLTR
ncbi:MAG: hypothetical protein V4472_25105 [Pseudomonadota bacterium]